MSIEINNITHSKPSSTGDEAKLNRSSEQPAAKHESGKSTTTDTVSLSDNAVQLGKLDSTVVTTPVVDTHRVEQLKQAISNGSYEIEPARIADRLMQFESVLKSGA